MSQFNEIKINSPMIVSLNSNSEIKNLEKIFSNIITDNGESLISVKKIGQEHSLYKKSNLYVYILIYENRKELKNEEIIRIFLENFYSNSIDKIKYKADIKNVKEIIEKNLISEIVENYDIEDVLLSLSNSEVNLKLIPKALAKKLKEKIT